MNSVKEASYDSLNTRRRRHRWCCTQDEKKKKTRLYSLLALVVYL